MVKRVLVTGGASFIGSHLVDKLMSKKSLDVIVLDNFSGGILENLSQHSDKPNFHLIEHDVRSKTVVKKALDNSTRDCVGELVNVGTGVEVPIKELAEVTSGRLSAFRF